MNIEKVKNYNNVMLAVIVTAGVAFAVIGLFSFIIFLFTEVFDFSSHNYSQSSPAQETIVNEEEQDVNKLYLVYDFPELIDTLQQIFVIPVSYRNVYELDQDYSRKISFSKNTDYSGYDGGSDYYGQKNYINLIIYDAKNNKSETLFKQKVLIGQYGTKYFKDDIFVLFEAAFTDSDKDGQITLMDQSSLFLYSINKKTLKQLQFGDKSVLQFSFIGDTKDIIVRFGYDPAKRTNEKQRIDAVVLCKYNYEQDQLVKINEDKLDKELQDLANKKN